MTIKARLPLFLSQKYLETRDSIGLFINNLEVITKSNTIIHAVRILIVMIALMMGYHHAPKENSDKAALTPTEIQAPSYLPDIKIP